jgi:hypothetical protein
MTHNAADITKDNYIRSVDNFTEYIQKNGGSSSHYDVQLVSVMLILLGALEVFESI